MKRNIVFSLLIWMLLLQTTKLFAAAVRVGEVLPTPSLRSTELNPLRIENRICQLEHFTDTIPGKPAAPVKEVPKSKKQLKPEPVSGAVKGTVKPIVPPVIKPVIVKPKPIIKPVIKIQ